MHLKSGYHFSESKYMASCQLSKNRPKGRREETFSQYNDFEFEENKYFFCGENDRIVLRINDHKWQLLAQTPHSGYLRVYMKDINGRSHNIYMHKLIEHFRHEPTDEEEE